jgi:multidrug efflux pump
VKLPEISVKRPVFATVIALLLAAFGAMAFTQLPTREYPDVSPAQVSIGTDYTGAAADVIETRITQPLEEEISGIEGIRSIRSSSSDGRSSINIEFDLGRDIDAATNDVRDKVARASRRLPQEAEKPIVSKADSESSPLVYLSIHAKDLPVMELNDYARRYIIDRFAVLPGVASVRTFGGGGKSMRIWLDRHRLAARQLTVADVVAALRRENLELPAGRLESEWLEFPVRVARNYTTAEDFRGLVIRRGADGHLIRLGEVARVEVGSETRRRLFLTNGAESMAIGVVKQSAANTVEVLGYINDEVEAIRQDLPPGMGISSSGDASAFIRAAISGVYWAMFLTVGLVALVILMFLGTLKATIIPVVCIPLSLLGAILALELFGYSINLITLLAMVLAIGLVVDDAIVVLENIYRRIEEGEPPLLAAVRGAKQVGFAVIATTAVLLAVFSPVIFMQDTMGRIFSELAVAISVAVVVSSLLALSLVPMLCSKFLERRAGESSIGRMTEALIARVTRAYVRTLRASLSQSWSVLLLAALALGALVPLMNTVQREFVPQEDQDTVFAIISAQEGTGMDMMRGIIERLQRPLLEMKASDDSLTRILFVTPFFDSTVPTRAFVRVSTAPWNERDYTVFELKDRILEAWQDVPGIRTMAFLPAGLGRRGASTPVQFVLQGQSYDELVEWRDLVMQEARDSGLFTMVNSDLRESQQQVHLQVDVSRAAALEVSVRDISEALQALMTEQEVSTYNEAGEEYPVIVQLQRDQRMSPDDITNIYVRSANGELVQLSNLITTASVADIGVLRRYDRMRAVTITGGLATGVTLGEALDFLDQVVRDKLPPQAKTDYRGESLEYKESSVGLIVSLSLALLVLYLVMAAQFESFVHPAVIMVTVPLALVGGLIGLVLTDSSLNLFSQIGLLMIIGIASKNGILLVEFINQMRDRGMAFEEAIVEACRLRLRPVLMTTISTLAGSVPLIVMTGPGSASRNVLGIVVLFGVAFATVFTLYLVPGFYRLLARHTGSPETLARQIEALEQQRPDRPALSD